MRYTSFNLEKSSLTLDIFPLLWHDKVDFSVKVDFVFASFFFFSLSLAFRYVLHVSQLTGPNNLCRVLRGVQFVMEAAVLPRTNSCVLQLLGLKYRRQESNWLFSRSEDPFYPSDGWMNRQKKRDWIALF